ncbi:MAG: hypothetical protein IPO48_07275 [Saprospiraceae bacterium]|nr:hypothetical protein [Saprospiraceae bacterium]
MYRIYMLVNTVPPTMEIKFVVILLFALAMVVMRMSPFNATSTDDCLPGSDHGPTRYINDNGGTPSLQEQGQL